MLYPIQFLPGSFGSTVIAQEFWSHGWKGCIADSKLEEREQADLDVLPVFPENQYL